MERPAKRQKLSPMIKSPVPSRTLDLGGFQRQPYFRRDAGKVILPRFPDVTVTAAIVEVAVNDDSAATTQVAVSASDVAVTLDSLGTLTVPGLGTTTALDPSGSGSTTTGSGSEEPFPSGNSTSITTEKTVTVTATSTFRVSYTNGTFITPTRTESQSRITGSNSDDDGSSDSSSSPSYTFGQGITYTDSTSGSATDAAGAGGYVSGVTATNTNSGSDPTSSTSGGSGGGIAPLTPEQTQIVGGIVGGVAGIAFVLVAILYVLRWYRRRLELTGRLPEQLASGTDRDMGKSGLASLAAPMSQSRSSLFTPGGIVSTLRRPASDMTMLTNTTSTTGADSEKGFYRVSGRKIPPVLSTGGDQYGGSYGAFEQELGSPISHDHTIATARGKHRHDLSESSFYRDEDGTYVGSGRPGSRSAPSSPLYPSTFRQREKMSRRPSESNTTTISTQSRDFATEDFDKALRSNLASMNRGNRPKPDGYAVSRNSPARTPVIQSPSTSTLRLPIQAPITMDEDIPEMPLPSPGIGLALGHDLSKQRMPSRLSARSGGSGKFREELS